MKMKNFSVVSSRPVEIKATEANGHYGNIQLRLEHALIGDEGTTYRGEVQVTMRKGEFLKAALQFMLSDLEEKK